MSVVGNALVLFNSPEVPTMYEELQYIQLASGLIAFSTGQNTTDFQTGALKMTTTFFCTSSSGISGVYGYIFSYGRSAGCSSVVVRQSNSNWCLRRVRNTFTAGSTQIATNTNLALEYYDTAGTQYLKVNGTQVVSSTLTDAIATNLTIYIGAYQGMAGLNTVPGRYGRFQVYDGDNLKFTSIPVRRKSDSAIGYLTVDRYKNKFFGTAESSGTIASGDITAGSVVA